MVYCGVTGFINLILIKLKYYAKRYYRNSKEFFISKYKIRIYLSCTFNGTMANQNLNYICSKYNSIL